MFRKPLKLVFKFKAQRRFLSEIDKPSLDQIRSKEAKGAMKDFIQKTATGSGEGGLWSRLRQDIAPPPVIETIRSPSSSSRGSSDGRPFRPYAQKLNNDDDDDDEEQSGQSVRGERKVGFNNAPKSKSTGFVKRPTTTSAPAYGGGGGGGGGFGAARRAKIQEEEEEAYLRGENNGVGDTEDYDLDEDDGCGDKPVDMAEFDQEDIDMMFDPDKESAAICSGKKTFPIEDMDMIDAFFMNGYMESMKTADGIYMVSDDSKKLRLKKMPKPRTMEQMVYSMKSNIRGAELGSAGHIIGEEAWNIVSRNMYYTENQKYEVTDIIAEKYNALKAHTSVKGPLRKVDGVQCYPKTDFDGIFEYGFNKGEDYMENQAYVMSMEDKVVVVNPYAQGPTDWSVQAVVDEDEL